MAAQWLILTYLCGVSRSPRACVSFFWALWFPPTTKNMLSRVVCVSNCPLVWMCPTVDGIGSSNPVTARENSTASEDKWIDVESTFRGINHLLISLSPVKAKRVTTAYFRAQVGYNLDSSAVHDRDRHTQT